MSNVQQLIKKQLHSKQKKTRKNLAATVIIRMSVH